MTREMTLNDILEDVFPHETERKNCVKEGKPVTIWLPADAKDSFDKLQIQSRRKFSKKVREVFLLMIKAAEARAV